MYASWSECLYVNIANHTALASFTSDASLLAGANIQPVFPKFFFANNQGRGKAVIIKASGVLSSTGTPTYTFTVRLCPTSGSLTGTTIGVTSALTTASGITNKMWELEMLVTGRTPALGTNGTIASSGMLRSPDGLAATSYPIEVSAPDTATWTLATIDSSIDYYLNLSVACSANSASNTIQCIQLLVQALN